MASPVTVKFHGGRELEASIRSLKDDMDVSKTTVRNAMQRGLVEAGQHTADAASSMAPDDPSSPPPDLHTSIAVGTKLTPHQSRQHKKAGKAFAEAFIGVTGAANVYAHLVEFGTADTSPQPFMRPAWEATKDAVLNSIGAFVGKQLDKAAARARAKALKKAS